MRLFRSGRDRVLCPKRRLSLRLFFYAVHHIFPLLYVRDGVMYIVTAGHSAE